MRLCDDRVIRTEATSFPVMTHFALAVSDLDPSVAWYETLFGAARSSSVTSPPSGFPSGPNRCSRCTSITRGPTTERHSTRTASVSTTFPSDVPIEMSSNGGWSASKSLASSTEIADAFYGPGRAFRDPDNIQLEFFVGVR